MTIRTTRTSATLASLALAAGALALAGWAFGIRLLTDWDNDGVAQMPNNALAVVTAATALLSAAFGRRSVTRVFAAITALIGAATLFEHLSGIDLGIDTLLLSRPWGQRGTMAPGRMGLPASVSLVLLGVSILLVSMPRARRAATGGGLTIIAISMLALIGYLFGADPLYAIPRFTTIALQSAVALGVLGAAVVAAVPEAAPMRLLREESSAGLLFRRSLPAVVALPMFLGWLRLQGQAAGYFDTAFGTSILVLTLIGLLVTLLWWGASVVSDHERALRESRDRFSLLFAKAPFPAALAALPEGDFVDVNEAFAKYFGYAREEVLGRTALDLGILSGTVLHDEAIQRMTRDGGLSDVELKLRTRDGSERIGLNNTTVVEIRGRKHLLSTIQDITERKAAEKALRQSADALLAADRMKDEFLATLSHELRTPLTAIVGWSQILLTADLGKHDQQIALEAIRSSARAQAQLVDDVLDVSRIITGKMRLRRDEADLASIVDAAVATVRPAADGKRIELRVSLDRTVPRVLVDGERIQQVVWNLLSNAIKFSDEGTTVDVELRAEGESALIVVTDQGPGIAPAFLPHVFERFRQADSSPSRSHAGLGIGLALSKDLVELHGGTIAAESEENRGARFTVRLPLGTLHRSERRPLASRPASAALDGVRVLYVDDREDARFLISTMLRQRGADVVEADSVGRALTVLSTEPPHVVVTDLAMPGRDGYDLLAAIRSDPRWNALPVLALTAQAWAGDEAHASNAGFRAFLRKPIESEELTTAVANAASGE